MQTFRTLLRHFDLTLAVETPEAEDLAWLQQVMAPAFSIETGAIAERAIAVIVDRHEYERLQRRRQADPGTRVPCFGFDGDGGEFRLWREPEPVVYDDELRYFYRLPRIGASTNRTDLLTDRWRQGIRIALLRLARELATQQLRRHDCVQLHAAAVSDGGRGLLICGPRRAGKTSLLLHLLRSGAGYIANDRALVRCQASGGFQVSGMPTMVSIRPGTQELFPDLGLARMRRWLARMTLAEVPEPIDATEAPAPPTPLSLSPKQLCHWLNSSTAAEASLAGLLFPVVDPHARGIRLEPLDRAALGEQLNGAVMSPGPSVLEHGDDSRSRHDAPVRDADVLRAVAQGTPGYRCVLGAGAFDDPDSALRVLALDAD